MERFDLCEVVCDFVRDRFICGDGSLQDTVLDFFEFFAGFIAGSGKPNFGRVRNHGSNDRLVKSDSVVRHETESVWAHSGEGTADGIDLFGNGFHVLSKVEVFVQYYTEDFGTRNLLDMIIGDDDGKGDL